MVTYYRDTLGLPVRLIDEQHKYAMFDTGAVRLALEHTGIIPDNPSDPEKSVIEVNFAVEDLVATIDILRDRGVNILTEVLQGPGYTYVKFADPEGNEQILFEKTPKN